MDINEWLNKNYKALREVDVDTVIHCVDQLVAKEIVRIRYKDSYPITITFITKPNKINRFTITKIKKSFNLLGLIGKKIKDIKLVSYTTSKQYMPKTEQSETGDNESSEEARTFSILSFLTEDNELSYIVCEGTHFTFAAREQKTLTELLRTEIG